MVAISSQSPVVKSLSLFPLPKPEYRPGSVDPKETVKLSNPKGSTILHRQLKRLQRQHSAILPSLEQHEEKLHRRNHRCHDDRDGRHGDEGQRHGDDRKGHRKVRSKRDANFESSCTKLPNIVNDKEEIFRRHSIASVDSREDYGSLYQQYRYSVYSKYSDKRDDRIYGQRFCSVYSKYSDDRDDHYLHHHHRNVQYGVAMLERYRRIDSKYSDQSHGANESEQWPSLQSKYSSEQNNGNNLGHHRTKHPAFMEGLNNKRDAPDSKCSKRIQDTDDNKVYLRLVERRFVRQQRRRPRKLLLQRAREKRRQCRNVFLKYSAELEHQHRLRRLGSGLLPPVMVDSHILTHMLVRLRGLCPWWPSS